MPKAAVAVKIDAPCQVKGIIIHGAFTRNLILPDVRCASFETTLHSTSLAAVSNGATPTTTVLASELSVAGRALGQSVVPDNSDPDQRGLDGLGEFKSQILFRSGCRHAIG